MAKLKEKKGKTLAQWFDILKKSGPASEKERREWLKSAHGFTTNYAWFVAERAGGNGGRDLSGHVFAHIKAPNGSRVDLGLALRDPQPVGRLIDTRTRIAENLWGRMTSCAPMASALFARGCSSATGRLTTGCRMPSCPTVAGAWGYIH